MRRLAKILGATVLGFATASTAQAATVFDSGSFGAGEFLSLQPLGNFDDPPEYRAPGKYRFTFELSTPAAEVSGELQKLVTFDEYCRDEGTVFFCGGNNFEVYYPLNQITPTKYITDVRLNPDKSVTSSGSIARTDWFEGCCYAAIDFETTAAGTYTFSASAIPEPATWLMLLFGFGAVGASLRSARHRQPQPANA